MGGVERARVGVGAAEGVEEEVVVAVAVATVETKLGFMPAV